MDSSPFPLDVEADFVALDVETANSGPSVCAIGLAYVRDLEVFWSGSTLVNPEVKFKGYNTRINGIRASDVADAPTLADLHENLRDALAGRLVVSHALGNFDLSQLNRSLARHSLVFPDEWVTALSSIAVAHTVWPLEESYSLDALTVSQGLPSFPHHDAEADAAACARLLAHAIRSAGEESLDAASQALGFRAWPFPFAAGHGVENRSAVEGKVFCFTGVVPGVVRSELFSMLEKAGAEVKDKMSGLVDILVVGPDKWAEYLAGEPSGKLKKIAKLRRASGQGAVLMGVREFWRMIGSGSSGDA